MMRASGPAGSKLSGVTVRHRTKEFPINLLNRTGSANIKVSDSLITSNSLAFSWKSMPRW
jgi:hypothetical protein